MPNKKYTAEALAAALSNIKNEKISIYKASQLYSIPRQTLRDKIKGKYTKKDRPGPLTVLTTEQEQLLVKWVKQLAENGFPIIKEQLLHSVSKLVKELGCSHKFKNGVPGRHWYEGFLKRNPSISRRVTQALTTARMGATEEKIRAWFTRIHQYLEANNQLDILKDPSRIFNCDESAFFLCPKGSGVLTSKGAKTVYTISGNDPKENLTLSFGASANGKLMPTLALFPYKRLPQHILAKYPKDWAIGRSESGWMTCETFYEYITNVFYPFLIKEKIKLPVIVFMDGHSSHLSLALSTFCKDHGIILIALLPNSTHITQPMDVAVFRVLKGTWKEKVAVWRLENDGNRLKRDDFAPILKECLSSLKSETIQNGFRACGLYPFDPDAVNYQRLIKASKTSNNACESVAINPESSRVSDTQMKSNEVLRQFEEQMGAAKIESFHQCGGDVWTGDVRDENLFYYWKQLYKNSKGLDISKKNPEDPVVKNSLDSNVVTLVENNTLNEPTVHMSDLLDLDKNSCLELAVQTDGSLITSTPKTQASSTGVIEINTEMCNEAKTTDMANQNLSHEVILTPEKNDPIVDSRKAEFPSPFKKCLMWPSTPKTSKPKRNLKRVTPAVAISDDFMEYQRRVEAEKIAKEEKKRKRESKKKDEPRVNLTQKRRKKKSLNENTSPNADCKDAETIVAEPIVSESIVVGDYVLIIYEGEKFPGIVTQIIQSKPEKKYEVKTMQMSGANWRWPEKDDILIYESQDVLKKLNPPVLFNNREVYSFSDLNKNL